NPGPLDDDIHQTYRQEDRVSLQVSGTFKVPNFTLNINTIFEVTPLDQIPNRRSGIILGQTGFIDQILYESIPRVILEKRGEIVEDSEWEAINIKAYINENDEMVEP
ncbi:MAG: hypothetical protein Q9214_005597, partial [Letrouitia sp. 1 TL-2023]